MNYPWSGRLGRVARCCIYCGTKGPSFGFSSIGDSCLECSSKRRTANPIPELKAELDAKRLKLTKRWCIKNNFDYENIIKLNKQYLPLFDVATYSKIKDRECFISNHYRYPNGDSINIYIDKNKVLLTDLGTTKYRCGLYNIKFPEIIEGFEISDGVITIYPNNIIEDFNKFCKVITEIEDFSYLKYIT